MKVSVIIPVYNVEEYLSRCIDSVLEQENAQIEVLLINDGSTDRSGDICDEYSKKDERIRVFHQDNSGVSSARNKGIENATCDWVCFVDADDWIEPNSLASVIDSNEGKTADITIARSFKNRNGIAVYEYFPFNKNMEGQIFKGPNLLIKYGYSRGSACGIIYRRLFLLDNNISFPSNLQIGEDSIFYRLCTIYAEKITFANVHFYNVYEREGSAFRSWSFAKILSMVDNINYIDKYIVSHAELTKEAVFILNGAKYGVVSNIYNYFHHSFSLRNYFILRKKIKNTLTGKIDTGDIKTNKNKVRLLNFSIDIFAITILAKNKLRNI